ncbi:MAG TPA: tetratricopeptide repeat protein [Pyrinomonadaceae bacterium]|nr:tetratricopeptide repeat protein [Pyrinomonadaceae bacterium]
MNLKKSSILSPTEILPLIEEARNAELCRNIESMQAAVKAFWEDFDIEPDLSGYEKPIQAELLRISGAFFSFYGYARNKKDYQIRGKDLLTQAIELFESESLTDKAAEAKVMLAHCYWNTGEIEESEALLEMIEAEVNENPLHPVYLKTCINRLLTLIWKKNFDQALKVIEKTSASIEYCSDLRMQVKFHTEAGIFYRSIKKYEQAVFHYNEAIYKAEKIGNQTSVSLNLNNLAFLHKETKNYEEAIRCADLAIETATKINNRGWLPHFLDTKALIYLDTSQFDAALSVINQSIEIFREGEDAAGLADALWTQVRCLLRLERKEEALMIFGKLLDIAETRIGESAVQKFTRAFSEEIYIRQGLPLAEEVQRFKKEQVRAALIHAKGKISEAARILGLKSHQTLSDILNNQFPGLYEEAGFRRRASRKAKEGEGESRRAFLPSGKILNEAAIAQIRLPDKNFAFDFPCSAAEFQAFYFDLVVMERFGIESGAVAAVVPVQNLKAGMLLLLLQDNEFILAKAEYDSWANVFYVKDEREEPLPFEAEQVVGEPVGYCSLDETDNKFIKFSRLLP